MWQPKVIKIENLFSHVDTEYRFLKNKCTMLFGRNMTDSGADSNGSGKSGLIEGVTLALTGKTCRDVNRTEFVNDSGDVCYVELQLENAVCDVKSLVVKRWIHRTKSAKIELWENGELNTEMTSVNECNARIFDLIGVTRDDLLHFFIVGQDSNYSFLTAGDSEQKKIISRLTNADVIEKRVESLKAQNKKQVAIIGELEKSIIKIDSYIEITTGQIDDEKANSEERFKDRMNNLNDNIDDQLDKIETIKERRLTWSEDLKEKISKLDILKSSLVDCTEIESKINKNNRIVRENKKQINEAKDNIDHLERILKGTTTCPKCSHEWNQGEDIDIKTIPEMVKVAEKFIEGIIDKNKKYLADNKNLNAQLEENDLLSSKVRKLNGGISQMKTDIEMLSKKDKMAQNNIEGFKEELKKLEKEKKNNTKVKSLQSKLKEYKADKDSEDDKLSKHLIASEEANFWIYHFSKKGFLTYLTNQSIKTIEHITNSYLRKFNTDLSVKIEGYKVLKNNDVRENITISIVRDGIKQGSFERYSGGEKGRVNLACIVGLQKLMNMSANNGGLNFLGLDEVFEGLDRTGQKDVLNILETLGVTTMVVTHRNDPIGAENEVCIEKVNGVSKLILNGQD